MNSVAILKNNIIMDNELSPEAIVAYALISMNTTTKVNYFYTSINVLATLLCEDSSNRIVNQGLQKGIKELASLNIIKLDEYSKGIYKIEMLNNIIKKNEFYIILDHMELIKIFRISNIRKISLFKLFQVYVFILLKSDMRKELPNTLKGKFNILSQSYLAESLNMTVKTFRKYINILETENVLLSKKVRYNNDDVFYSGYYGLVYYKVSDQKFLSSYVGEYIGAIVSDNIVDQGENKKRLSSMYYYYMNSTSLYSYSELMELLKFCSDSNSSKYDVARLKEKINSDLAGNSKLREEKNEYEMFEL